MEFSEMKIKAGSKPIVCGKCHENMIEGQLAIILSEGTSFRIIPFVQHVV